MLEPEVVASIQLEPGQYDYLFALGDGDPAEGIAIMISERERIFSLMEKLNLGRFSGLAIMISERERIFSLMEKLNLGRFSGLAKMAMMFRKKFREVK